jgi:integrase/recombinase XerD
MLEDFLEHPFFLNRHRQAPLLKERELFLSHLQQQGTSRKALRNLSGEMLPVMRLLKLTEMRDVSLEEIQRAALCWAREQRTNPKAQSYGNSASFFVYAAKKWLRFHGRLKLPIAPPMRFADQLNYFARYMTEEQGLSPYSVRSHCAKTSKFLEWFGERHRLLTRTRIEDVDEFLAMKGAGGWSRRSSRLLHKRCEPSFVMPRHADGAPPVSRRAFRAQESTNTRVCRKAPVGNKCAGSREV